MISCLKISWNTNIMEWSCFSNNTILFIGWYHFWVTILLQHIHSLVQLSSCLYENSWQSWEKNIWHSREKIFDSSEGRIKRNWLGQCNVSLVTACGGILDDTHRSWSGSIHCTIYMCVRYKHCVRTQIIIILFSLFIHDSWVGSIHLE